MFIKDPCGIVCVVVTYLAVFYADYVIIQWVVLQTMVDSLWGTFNVVMFNTVIFMLMVSHIKAVITDPGTIPLPQTRVDFSDIHSPESGCEFVNWTACGRCETYRPPRAHHCRICQRCIRRMDHHCPWINNCVGERNQKYFIQFLFYVGTLSIYAVTLVVVSWMKECKDCSQDIPLKQTRIMHSIILLLESALFGMFVTAILVDQLQAILTDETAVEQLPRNPKYTVVRNEITRLKPGDPFVIVVDVDFMKINVYAYEFRIIQLQIFGNQLHSTSTVFVIVISVQKQGPYRPHRSKMVLLAEVCGEEHPALWLLPCGAAPGKAESPLIDYEV